MRSLARSALLASVVLSPGLVLATGSWSTRALGAEGPALPLPLELPSPLALPDVLAAVRARAPALIEGRRLAEAAALRPRTLGRVDDPTVSLEWWQQPLDFQSVPLMVTARQPIPWPRTLGLQREAGQREAQLAHDEVAVVARRLEAEATRGYFELWFAEQALAVNTRMATLMQHVVDVTQSQYRVGRAAQADVLRAQSELLLIEGERFDLERDRAESVARLDGLLDRPPGAPLGPAATTPEIVEVPSRAALVEALVERRPELLRARHAIVAAEARKALAEREGRPALEAWAGYMVNVGGPDSFTVGVSSTLPLFSHGKREATVASEQAGIEAALATLATTLRQAEVELESALARIDAASRHVRLHRERLLPLAESALESADAAYLSGRGPFATVLDAARAVRAHHMDHLRFLGEYARRFADLEEAVGAPLASLGAIGADSKDRGGRP